MTRSRPPSRSLFRRRIFGIGIAAIATIALIMLVLPFLFLGERLKGELETALGEAIGGEVRIQGVAAGFFPPQITLRNLRLAHPGVPGKELSVAEVKAPLPIRSLFGGGRALAQALMHTDITLGTVRFLGEKAPSLLFDTLALHHDAQGAFLLEGQGSAQEQPLFLNSRLGGAEDSNGKRAFHLEAQWGAQDKPKHEVRLNGAMALAPEIAFSGQAALDGPDLANLLAAIAVHAPIPSWSYALEASVTFAAGVLRAEPLTLRLNDAEAKGFLSADANTARLSLAALKIGQTEDLAIELEWSAGLFTLHQARARLWGMTDVAAFGLGDGKGGFEGALDIKHPSFSYGATLYTEGDALILAGKPIINGVALDRLAATLRPNNSSLHLSLEHKNASDLIRNATPGALHGEMDLARQDKDWVLSNLNLRLGTESLSGAGRLALSAARPRISAQLKADRLDWDLWNRPSSAHEAKSKKTSAPPVASAPASSQPAPTPQSKGANIHPRWSRDLISLPTLAWDADIHLSVAHLRGKNTEIQDADITMGVNDGAAKARITGRIFDGRLEADAQMPAIKDKPEITTTLRVTGADAQKILRAFAGLSVLEGRVDLETQLTAKGQSEAEWISSLAGQGRISGGEGRVTGFDLKAASDRLTAARDLPGLLGVLQAAVSGGQTRLTALAGSFTIRNGQLLSDDLRLTAEGGRADAQIRADLPLWTTESQVALFLNGLDGAPLLLRFAGPIDDPRKFLDANAFQRALLTKLAPPKEDGAPPAKPKLKDVLKGLLR